MSYHETHSPEWELMWTNSPNTDYVEGFHWGSPFVVEPHFSIKIDHAQSKITHKHSSPKAVLLHDEA